MLALLFCVALAQPFAPIGISDDWSYIWTARVLANTGRLTYNGWGAMPLGWQAYLGALFIKLFGFSFTATRFSVMIVSLICAALMQRIFVRTGAIEGTATIATLSLVLSPLYLPLSFSFMSDIPALFVLVLCIYSCVRAFQSNSDNSALGWLIFAALSNLVGGTVRQPAWLGVLVMVPMAAWYMRSRRHLLPVAAALWIFSVIGVVSYMRWFRMQPYAVIDKVFYLYHFHSFFYAAEVILGVLVCLLPIGSVFWISYPENKRLARNAAALVGAVAGAILFWWARTTPSNYFSIFRSIPFSVPGNYVTNEGVAVGLILGWPAEVLPIPFRFLLVVGTVSAFSCFLVFIVNARTTLLASDTCPPSGQRSYLYVPNSYLVTLLGPFAAVYFFLIVTRIAVYDRYFLPLQFVFVLIVVRIYRQVVSEQLPRLCLIVVLVFAAYGTASMHDLFAYDRARVEATKEIIATEIPRTEIEGGFEYDGWTQLEQTGYVNEPKIGYPLDAYHPWTSPEIRSECIGYFRGHTPSIHPQFHLAYAPDDCFETSHFAPVPYRTWLSPRQRTIYILQDYRKDNEEKAQRDALKK
jgi:hypothetical protein